MLLLGLASVSYAQRSSELSADIPDGRTMAVQDKVEKLFATEKYERAFFIYRNELTPLGDKYAQYMVGFMYQNGLGVDRDDISAAAWYQLAAERDTREFVAVRDHFMRAMDETDKERSVEQYRALRAEHCDLAVLFESIKRDYRELGSRTGTRVSGGASSVEIVGGRDGRFESGNQYYTSLRENLKARLALLKEFGDFDDLDIDSDRIRIAELERRVAEQIESGGR